MAFSILSKRMLENDDIRNIVDRIESYEAIFSYDQYKELGSKNLFYYANIILKEYDSIQKRGFRYQPGFGLLPHELEKYGYVLPIIQFEEIKESSRIISEDEDAFTVQYGIGLTSRVSSSDELQKLNIDSMNGDIIETNRKITIFLSKDGKKTQLRIFKNQQTGKEYVFMKKKDDETFDDSLDINALFVGIVSPLTWTVDKKTGLAICNNPLFLSEKCGCEYDKSSLAKFLESDEFVEELGINQEKKQEKSSSVNNPFGIKIGKKSAKLSLEDKIRVILNSGRSVPYLVGHPGVGKSQVAKSINKNCVQINISTYTPDEFTGKTAIIPGDKIITRDGDKTIEHNEKGRTATAEPAWYTQLVEMANRCRQSNERCILLLDEFDKLTPNMQVFVNGIVDNPRTIAGWEIPDNVDIILTGNTEEYSDAAFNISGEVASRLTKLEVTTDAIDWLKWASNHNIDPVVKAYLHNFPNKIIQDVKDKNGEYDWFKSLTPRTWDQQISEHLQRRRVDGEPSHLELFMDEECQNHFEEFIVMYFNLGVEEILKGNMPIDVFDLTHDKIQIIINCLIATATTEEEITNALTFIKQNNLSEYEALFEKRWMEINNTDEDILKLKLAKSALGERRTSYGK